MEKVLETEEGMQKIRKIRLEKVRRNTETKRVQKIRRNTESQKIIEN